MILYVTVEIEKRYVMLQYNRIFKLQQLLIRMTRLQIIAQYFDLFFSFQLFYVNFEGVLMYCMYLHIHMTQQITEFQFKITAFV